MQIIETDTVHQDLSQDHQTKGMRRLLENTRGYGEELIANLRKKLGIPDSNELLQKNPKQ